MIELKSDRLVASFPEVHRAARLTIDFQRTLRIPDDAIESPAPRLGPVPAQAHRRIYEDPYSILDWETDHGSRCFVHLVNSVGWWQITGERPPAKPLTAQEYTADSH